MPNILAFGQGMGLDMRFLDLDSLMKALVNDALNNGGALYGITNVSTPCGAFPGSIGIPCNVSLFSDALHPSARAHQLLGDAALRAVPEPATLALRRLARPPRFAGDARPDPTHHSGSNSPQPAGTSPAEVLAG